MKALKSTLTSLLLCGAAWASAEQTVCHEGPVHLIVEGQTGEVGTHFLVKYKSKNPTASPRLCDYVIEPGDFEIHNEDAEYFLALRGDLLILDSGTGPEPRGLIIWNLKQRAKVYSGIYADATLNDEYIEFWLPSAEASVKDCPEASEWLAGGLSATIETRVRLEFSDLEVQTSTQTRCMARQ